MSTRRTSIIVAAMMLCAPPAWALSFSLGAHLGLSTIQSNHIHTGTSTVLAWPSNAFTYQPALRIGVGDSRRAHEGLLDSGFFFIDQAGSSLSLLVTTASYQHTFAADRTTSLFANLGVGLYREWSAARFTSSVTWGAGVGVRHLVAERHGALRAEGRVDLLEPEPSLGRPQLTTLGLRLGFDLRL